MSKLVCTKCKARTDMLITSLCPRCAGWEIKRLRRIEAAIRECPTTGMASCKALIYTVKLRDALEVKP